MRSAKQVCGLAAVVGLMVLAASCGNGERGGSSKSATAVGATVEFRPFATVAVADPRAGVASDVTITYDLPATAFPRLFAVDLPAGWEMPGWQGHVGDVVGTLVTDLKIGSANGACDVPVHAEYRLLAATADGATIDTTAVSKPPLADIYHFDSDGLPQGVTRVPSFIAGLHLSGVPYARAYGQSNVNSFPTYIDVVVQDTGGRRSAEVILNDPNYTSPIVTSTCGPLHLVLTLFGVSPSRSGVAALLNPAAAGSYHWSVRSAPAPDEDADGTDNALDDCASKANRDQADGDHDALGDACDPSPSQNRNGGDEDGDGFKNGADTCPLTANPDQRDADLDYIGDACDDSAGPRNGPVVTSGANVHIDDATAPAAALPAPRDLASLPPVYNPDARDTGANPSGPQINPEDAPKPATGAAAAMGRDDCPDDWRALKAQGGWSICYPATWTFGPQTTWFAGVWEEGALLSLRAGGTPVGSGTNVLANIGVMHRVESAGGLLPPCAQPVAASVAGVAGNMCGWTRGDDGLPSMASSGVAYYLPHGNGRLLLEGVAYSSDPAVRTQIERIFETLRLP